MKISRVPLFVILLVCSFLIVFSHRPDAILNAQFFAEDGTFWYADAYNNGFVHALFTPHTGYFQTISRLTAAISLLLPLSLSPLLFNIIAILIQIAPVLYFNSYRFAKHIPNMWIRLVLSLIYLILPNVYEIHANITNAQWHLALLAFLVIIASPTGAKHWRICDGLILLLSGLSGPFVLFLLPIACIHFLVKRVGLHNVLWLTLPFLIQCSSLVLSANDSRPHLSLGASFDTLSLLVSGQIFTGGILGVTGYSYLYEHFQDHSMFWIILFLIGTGIILFVFKQAKLEFRLFIIYSSLILTGSLISPTVGTEPQWKVMASPFAANRYYFFPILTWILIVFFLIFKLTNIRLRALFVTIFSCIFLIGIYNDWIIKPYYNFDFQRQATIFEKLPSGSSISIPINPPGWKLDLIKK